MTQDHSRAADGPWTPPTPALSDGLPYRHIHRCPRKGARPPLHFLGEDLARDAHSHASPGVSHLVTSLRPPTAALQCLEAGRRDLEGFQRLPETFQKFPKSFDESTMSLQQAEINIFADCPFLVHSSFIVLHRSFIAPLALVQRSFSIRSVFVQSSFISRLHSSESFWKPSGPFLPASGPDQGNRNRKRFTW